MTWGDFGYILWLLWVTLGSFSCYLEPFWPYRRRWTDGMRIISPFVRPKRAPKQQIHIFATFFMIFTDHECSHESLKLSGPEGFWGHSRCMLATLGWLLDYFGYVRVTLESFEATFRKYSFSHMILMILYDYLGDLRWLWVHFKVTLGHFQVIFVLLWITLAI